MESRRKLLVTALLGCAMAAGVSIWLVRGASANRTAPTSVKAPAQQTAAARAITLNVEGRSPQLRYQDAADLEGSAESEGAGQAVALKVGDLYANGWKDMVSVHWAGDHTEVQVRAGDSRGEFGSPVTYTLNGTHPSAVETGDFNADGMQDIAVLDSEKATISFLYQDDQHGFKPGPVLNVGGSPIAMVADDLDRDGLTDIVVAGAAELRVLLGQGDFAKAVPDIIAVRNIGTLTDVKAGHIGFDHFKDLVVSGSRGVAVLNGQGDGTFGRPRVIGTEGVGRLAVGDLKSEGFSSIVGTQLSGADVIVWPARGNKGVGKAEHYLAGSGMTSVAIGFFKGTSHADIAVGTDSHVMLLLSNSEGFGSSAPIALDVPDATTALAAGAMQYGIHKITVAHKSGIVVPAVTTGGRIDVSTIVDENDCINCTVAGLLAIAGTNGAPGGGQGVSLREAITAVNNDSVINGSSAWTIGFANINSLPSGPGHNQSLPQFAGPGLTNSFWVLQTTVAKAMAFGNLPPLIAAATTIDGSLVDTSANGVNNTLGPRVQITGVSSDGANTQVIRLFFISSSAPNSNIMNLAICGSLNDGVTIAAPNCTIQGNNVGIWADGTVHMGQVNIASGIDFQSGTLNETVTGNLVSNNGAGPGPHAGIMINGVSQSTSIPQNNIITNNFIGLNAFGNSAGNTGDGILLLNGAVGNTITNNTISGNTLDGVHEIGNITADAIIQNNKIGTDAAGVTIKGQDGVPIGNHMDGVDLGAVGAGPSLPGNPKFNTVSGNVISGNLIFGIEMGSDDSTPQFDKVTNNKIGTNVAGSVQLPNATGGVALDARSSNDAIGGTHAADQNIISGNGIGTAGPGITISNQASNHLIQNNLIGPNNLGAGPPVDLAAAPPQTSNKGGGVFITGGAFANKIIANFIAFNNDGSGTSGITDSSTGNFNLFSQNQIFLNPQNTAPTDPQIIDSAGQQGMRNSQVTVALNSLIKVDSATTITQSGQTTVTGTANFLTNGVTANINQAVIEIFASQRGSTSVQASAEAQAFIGSVSGTSFTVDPNDLTGNTLDWSFNGFVPAPFFNPVQTPTLFITATITTGDTSTSPLSIGHVSAFVTGGGGGGGGGGCAVTANPTGVTFNNATVGVQVSQNVVITNTGTGSVSVTGDSLTQTGTAFSLGAVTFPVTLGPTQTLTIPVRFTPPSLTPATATLTVTDSCLNLVIPISGNPTSVKISALPNPVVFPDANIGSSSTATLTVINFGTGTLSITALTIAGGGTSPFSVVSPAASGGSPFTVGGTSTGTVTLKFAPTIAGAQTGSLTIVSNDPITPSLTVGLNATGKATVPPTVIVNQPAPGSIVASGSTFTVGFGVSAASGGGTIVSYTASLSLDGGATFTSVLAGPGAPASAGINSFIATAPNATTTTAVVKVQVTDSNSLVGTGLSGFFTIGTPPVVTGAQLFKKLFVQGTGILPGAVVVISSTGETFSLDEIDSTDFLVQKFTIGSQGNRVRVYRPQVTFRVRNLNGLSSNLFTSQ